ncbi:TPA: hypothetical protein JI248_02850 [Acinetobacter baumannii]|nr:hypothetical protein [Acinetobacter baumannii]
MNSKIWQELLILESRDSVSNLYTKIHSRTLNTQRTIAITNAAKQAREYFRNAYNANYSVKPLLTFYGIASLSRSLILLLKRSGGEETLSMGHGLTAEAWRDTFSGNMEQNLSSLLDLKISSSSGLFSDLLAAIENTSCINTNGSKSNWHISYPISERYELKFGDILKRLADIRSDLLTANHTPLSTLISDISFDCQEGLKINTYSEIESNSVSELLAYNYTVSPDSKDISATADIFNNAPLIFKHTNINKMFGSIPQLHFSPPLLSNKHVCEIGLLYIASFTMSMLVRYFPTIWVSITQGEKGDVLWPTIYKTQQVVESSFPELVLNFINYKIKNFEVQTNEN